MAIAGDPLLREHNNTIGADTGMTQYTVVVVDDEPSILQARTLHEIIDQKNTELQELLCQLTEKNDRLNDAREYAENIVETVCEPLLVNRCTKS